LLGERPEVIPRGQVALAEPNFSDPFGLITAQVFLGGRQRGEVAAVGCKHANRVPLAPRREGVAVTLAVVGTHTRLAGVLAASVHFMDKTAFLFFVNFFTEIYSPDDVVKGGPEVRLAAKRTNDCRTSWRRHCRLRLNTPRRTSSPISVTINLINKMHYGISLSAVHIAELDLVAETDVQTLELVLQLSARGLEELRKRHLGKVGVALHKHSVAGGGSRGLV